jgi:hypothetical protein
MERENVSMATNLEMLGWNTTLLLAQSHCKTSTRRISNATPDDRMPWAYGGV